MQPGEGCMWFLIKSGEDDFAIQYIGPNPDTEFPSDLTGILALRCSSRFIDVQLMGLVESFRTKLVVEVRDDRPQ